ncbi:MAG: apolipoprotein N-acyltransferase [Rhodoferax sp.]
MASHSKDSADSTLGGELSLVASAGVAGAAGVLGWAPYGLWWVAVLAYSCLFFLLRYSRGGLHAAVLGMFFGMGMHITGHTWVMQALHAKLGMSMIAAVTSTAIFVLYLSLFTAIPCAIWSVLMRGACPGCGFANGAQGNIRPFHLCVISPILLASLLTMGEWSRGHLFNGIASLSLGYGLIDTAFAGYSPIFGVYGVSWLGLLAAFLLITCLLRRNAFFSFLLLVIPVIGYWLGFLRWTMEVGEPMSYRLIQSNVAQEDKLNAVFREGQVFRLVAYIKQQAAELVVTSETAFPLFFSELPVGVLEDLRQFSSSTNSNVFIGIVSNSSDGAAHNSLIEIRPGISSIAQYNKEKLMPFGEYMPLGFSWYANYLNIPFGDLSAGAEVQSPLSVGNQRIGVLICQEEMNGDHARRSARDVGLFVNPSNLAWFEGTQAIAQYLQVARMRALESGRPVLRAANTGITAHIDPRGGVIRYLPERFEGVLSGEVRSTMGSTPYVILGDWPILLACSLSLLVAIFPKLRPRARSSQLTHMGLH